MPDSEKPGFSNNPRAESALMALLQDTIHIGIALTNKEGKLEHVNRGMCELLGFAANELCDRHYSDFFPPQLEKQELEEGMRNSERDDPISQSELQLIKKNGSSTWASVWRQSVTLEDCKECWLITAVDISERKQLEENRLQLEAQARQQDKSETLSLISSTIANRINNLLTPILGYADLARELLPGQSPVEPMLEEVIVTARQASEFAQQLLVLSAKKKMDVRDVHLSQFVDETWEALPQLISDRSKVELNSDLAEHLPLVRVSAAQLRQLISNLVANADDAIGEERGKITVKTGKVEVEHLESLSPIGGSNPPGRGFVCLEVSDTGCGLPKEQLDKIFDPFFTTKPQGSGMGLATVLEIAQGSGGLVKVSSEPGTGTTFQVLLPALSTDEFSQKDKNITRRENSSAQKTILVIESDEGVAALVQVTLESAGFQVILATEESQGLDLLRQRQSEIAALLLDFSFPRNQGLQVVDSLGQLKCIPPVLLMTGHSVPELQEQLPNVRIEGIVQKPFAPSDLIRIVNQFATP